MRQIQNDLNLIQKQLKCWEIRCWPELSLYVNLNALNGFDHDYADSSNEFVGSKNPLGFGRFRLVKIYPIGQISPSKHLKQMDGPQDQKYQWNKKILNSWKTYLNFTHNSSEGPTGHKERDNAKDEIGSPGENAIVAQRDQEIPGLKWHKVKSNKHH